jgi:hypothetical protein
MKSIIQTICIATFVATAPGYIAAASATAFAGVDEAIWMDQFDYYQAPDGSISNTLPAGITVSCFGGAGLFVQDGCSNSASLSLFNNSGPCPKLAACQ